MIDDLLKYDVIVQQLMYCLKSTLLSHFPILIFKKIFCNYFQIQQFYFKKLFKNNITP